jgi:hypothetical protein
MGIYERKNNELETSRKTKTIRELYGGINK